MKKLIAGNWKMHGDVAMAQALAAAVAAKAGDFKASVIVCPPAILIPPVYECLTKSAIMLGGQDCSTEATGAYTGDISATMLKDSGCSYVIVGHSERRQYHKESDTLVSVKAEAAINAGLIPIICVGETDSQRTEGQAEAVVGEQVAKSLPKSAVSGNFVLAYEPVWAIGSGKVPTSDDIRAMHAHILAVAARKTGVGAPDVAVLYGGSVKASNSQEILAIPGVCGALVGGASLKAEEFCAIAANCGA